MQNRSASSSNSSNTDVVCCLSPAEIEAGNKVIAGFMGVHKYGTSNMWQMPNKGLLHSTELRYHSSWDWLKPVISKILTYGLVYGDEVRKITKISIVVDIIPCWEKVVEFIKYCNQDAVSER